VNDIRDFLPPEPGAGFANALRAVALEDAQQARADEEKQRERATQLQDLGDAAEAAAFVGHRPPMTQAQLFQTVSAIADAEDAKQERAEAARAAKLDQHVHNLSSERDMLRRSEDASLAVARARAKSESLAAARYSSSSRRSSYR
jgi:hypothetical protein